MHSKIGGHLSHLASIDRNLCVHNDRALPMLYIYKYVHLFRIVYVLLDKRTKHVSTTQYHSIVLNTSQLIQYIRSLPWIRCIKEFRLQFFFCNEKCLIFVFIVFFKRILVFDHQSTNFLFLMNFRLKNTFIPKGKTYFYQMILFFLTCTKLFSKLSFVK